MIQETEVMGNKITKLNSELSKSKGPKEKEKMKKAVLPFQGETSSELVPQSVPPFLAHCWKVVPSAPPEDEVEEVIHSKFHVICSLQIHTNAVLGQEVWMDFLPDFKRHYKNVQSMYVPTIYLISILLGDNKEVEMTCKNDICSLELERDIEFAHDSTCFKPLIDVSMSMVLRKDRFRANITFKSRYLHTHVKSHVWTEEISQSGLKIFNMMGGQLKEGENKTVMLTSLFERD